MSVCNERIASLLALYLFFFSSIIFPVISSLSFEFNFSGTNSLPDKIVLDGDAFINNAIKLTKDDSRGNFTESTGRAFYKDPFPLWDEGADQVADFTTHFQFIINASNYPGDGLAFFLSTYSSIPQGSIGGSLGIFNATENQTVAVEFDTFQNYFDPSGHHVGIDVNSIVSVANVSWNSSMSDGSTANAWISYNATTKNLSVFLTYEDNPTFNGNSILSYIVDLRELLPENVWIGFSAATGSFVELHQLLYWEFSSSNFSMKEQSRNTAPFVIGLGSGIGVLVSLVGFSIWFILRRKKARRGTAEQEEQDNIEDYDETIDDEFERMISLLALYLFLFSSSILFPVISSLNFEFNFSDYNKMPEKINPAGDATFAGKLIKLTRDDSSGHLGGSVGGAWYNDPFPLWDKATNQVADFTTHFKFIIKAIEGIMPGDGLTFFLSTYPWSIPEDSGSGDFGIFKPTKNNTENQTVAVEFDTFMNDWAQDPSDYHVGIDVHSIVSVETFKWDSSMINGSTANAWISYNATTNNLSVFLTYEDNPTFSGKSTLSHIVNLTELLPENVSIGFSAATGAATELNQILYWKFNSSTILPPNIPEPPEKMKDQSRSTAPFLIGLATAIGVLVSVVGFSIWFILRRNKARRGTAEQEEQGNIEDYDVTIDDEFEKGRGPRRFAYSELTAATKNFANEGKLGEGGFGEVYRGFLKDPGLEVAIKRVSKGSKQGRKEYIAEVKIISQLRHPNLVQLVGWCHDRGDFLLVYSIKAFDKSAFNTKHPALLFV